MAITAARLLSNGTYRSAGTFDEVTYAVGATNGSIKFVTASTQYLTVPANAAFTLGVNDFTIEWWQYQTTRGAYDSPWCYDNSAVTWQTKLMYVTVGLGGHNFAIANGVNTWAWIPSLGALPALNAWHHYAIVRQGTSWAVFIDGVKVASTIHITVNIAAQAGVMNIGASTSSSAPFGGYISNFRFINGTAVYNPTLTTLTVPTTGLTAITNTKLLLNMANNSNYLKDSSSNNFTVTNVNGATSSSLLPFTGGNPSANKVTISTIFTAGLDEVTLQDGSIAKRETSDGRLLVSGQFDEVTGIS